MGQPNCVLAAAFGVCSYIFEGRLRFVSVELGAIVRLLLS